MRNPADGDEALDPALVRTLRAALDATHDATGGDDHPSEAEVARYLRRELSDDETERLERHAAACATCADELALAAAVEADAQAAERDALAPADAPQTHVQTQKQRTARAATGRGAPDARAARPARVERAAPRRRSRTWTRVAAGVVVLVGAAVLARAGGELLLARLEPLVFERVAGLLGRGVTSDDTSLVLAGGPGLRIDGLAIADDPAFGGDFVRVAGTTLRLDAGALLRGAVRGEVHLDAPRVRLARDAGGRWNVATLAGLGDAALPDRAYDDADAARAVRAARNEQAERAVRLTSASITDATLAIDDATAGGRELVLRSVDGSYASPAAVQPGTIRLRGRIGAGDGSFALAGEIGPFEGATQPSYRFAELAVQRLPLADVPGAPRDVRGELTFRGSLATSGSGADALVMNASGAGDLGLCCGELRERNLTRALVTALAREAAVTDPADTGELVARALEAPALAAALAQSATPFEDIAGTVQIANGGLSFDELVLDTPLFQGIATGSLSRTGALDARGTVTLAAAATSAVTAAFPEARRLFGDGDELVVPFTVAGTWPDVTVQVDTRSAIARLLREHDPRALTLARALFVVFTDSARFG